MRAAPFPFVIEWADGRITVWPVKDDAANDLDACPQRDRISRKPARRVHGKQDVFLGADKSDIERIARDVAPGAGHHGQGSKAWFVLVMTPQRGQQEVGKQEIGEENARKNDPPSSPARDLPHLLSVPACCDGLVQKSRSLREPPRQLASFRTRSIGGRRALIPSLAPARLFREHGPGGHGRRWRRGRKVERQPDVPARGPVCRIRIRRSL